MTDVDLLPKKARVHRDVSDGAAPLSDALRAAIGLRNVLVHGYTAVDLNIVHDMVTQHLSEIENFVNAVRARLVISA